MRFCCLLLLVVGLLSGCERGAAQPLAEVATGGQAPSLCDLHPDDPRYLTAAVRRVVDGDTIIVVIDGAEQRVRYIGVNAPESVKPDTAPEFYGPEASDYNKRLVTGKDVCLEKDVSDKDKFDRLLRYVYVDDMFVNAQLVRDGYAEAVTYKPDIKHQVALDAAEREARSAQRGLWGRR